MLQSFVHGGRAAGVSREPWASDRPRLGTPQPPQVDAGHEEQAGARQRGTSSRRRALGGEGNGARARAQHHPRQLQVTCPEGLTHFSERTCTWRVRVTRWSGPGAGVGVPLKGNERPAEPEAPCADREGLGETGERNQLCSSRSEEGTKIPPSCSSFRRHPILLLRDVTCGV